MKLKPNGCWGCKYQQRGGMTFLGLCKYFEIIGKEKKEIPPDVVDVGCSFRIPNEN
jgi:hypothetical protein|tara:strand:+ start:1071 stop:1238 length:168 start_codon:yes stop_codon:yes gene_type:complete